MPAFSVSVNLNVIECSNCGMPFGITQDFEQRRRDDHRVFYCPTGHHNVYDHESEAEKLRRQLKATQSHMAAQQARHDQVKAELEDTKAQFERAKSRISKGVCPCCNRQFANLHRHMTTKHPSYKVAK